MDYWFFFSSYSHVGPQLHIGTKSVSSKYFFHIVIFLNMCTVSCTDYIPHCLFIFSLCSLHWGQIKSLECKQHKTHPVTDSAMRHDHQLVSHCSITKKKHITVVFDHLNCSRLFAAWSCCVWNNEDLWATVKPSVSLSFLLSVCVRVRIFCMHV